MDVAMISLGLEFRQFGNKGIVGKGQMIIGRQSQRRLPLRRRRLWNDVLD